MKTTHLLLAILLIPVMAGAQRSSKSKTETKGKEETMSLNERNKETVRKLYEQSLNRKNLELLHDFVSEDYVGAYGKKGTDGFREPVDALIKAFPDANWEVQELISEGEKVVVKWKFTGTHTGPFQHIAATNKEVSNEGLAIFKFEKGKIIDGQVHTDRLGFLQELGLVPLDLARLSNRDQKGDIIFIDKFLVPEKSKQAFIKRMNINRQFIKNLPGFIEDVAYESMGESGNLTYITIAVWDNEKSLNEAKEAVETENKKQDFNPKEMMERLNITMERGIFKEMEYTE